MRHALPCLICLLVVGAPAASLAARAPAAGAPDAPQVMILEDLFRLPGETEDYLLGRILDARLDGDGNLLLLDYGMADVKVFAPDGRFLRTLSRRGEGPGELDKPTQLLPRAGGGLGALERFPPRIVWLDAEGLPAGETDLGDGDAGTGVWGARASEGRLYVVRTEFLSETTSTSFRPVGTRSRLLRRDPGGGPAATLLEEPFRPVASENSAREVDFYDALEDGIWDVDAEGRVWLAPERNRYRVVVLDGEGRQRVVVDRDVPLRHRSAVEKERIREREHRRNPRLELEVDDRAPAIRWLRVAEAPEVWVGPDLACPDRPAGLVTAFDVFSPAGQLLRSVEVRGDWDCRGDRLFFVADDRIVLVRDRGEESGAGGDEDASGLEVFLARLRPRGGGS